ncbi:MAG: flagellar FliJ family protein [bacterium]|nr:flagellar FliJ family protein [bacterium]
MAWKPEKSKRFKYNLASVLKFRNIREEQEREKYSEAQRKLEEEERKEKELKDQQASEYAELKEHMSGGHTLNFDKIQMRRGHLDTLKVKVTDQEKATEVAEEHKIEKHKDLVKAVKDRKILDKDKEKKNELWRKLMIKEENKFLDEIAGIGMERKRREKES